MCPLYCSTAENHIARLTFLQDPPGYWIEDTSTNGTLINGDRIPKGSSAPVKEGDRVQLSWNAAGEAAALLEYVQHHAYFVKNT